MIKQEGAGPCDYKLVLIGVGSIPIVTLQGSAPAPNFNFRG